MPPDKPFLFIESEDYYNRKKQIADPDIDAEEKIMDNGGRSNKIVNQLVLDFFNGHLKGIYEDGEDAGTDAGYAKVVCP